MERTKLDKKRCGGVAGIKAIPKEKKIANDQVEYAATLTLTTKRGLHSTDSTATHRFFLEVAWYLGSWASWVA